MTDRPADLARDSEVPREKKLEDLFEMIDDIETCMFTTRRADGLLVSRPMQVQLRTDQGELWFVTDEETAKLDELETDAHVNCSFWKGDSREFISISGRARPSRDRTRIRELHAPDWRAWFPDEGGERDGGPDDPRMVLIQVEPITVTYLKNDTPRPIAMFKVAAAAATGSSPDIGSLRHVTDRELEGGAGRG